MKFSPDRLGHFNYYDEQLYDMLIKKEKQIPIETCPTSNIFTMELNDYEDHHFHKFFLSNYPISICTDDPCVFEM